MWHYTAVLKNKNSGVCFYAPLDQSSMVFPLMLFIFKHYGFQRSLDVRHGSPMFMHVT